MGILNRKEFRYYRCNEDVPGDSDLAWKFSKAVESLTAALEKIRDCRDTSGVKSYIAKEELERAWGDES